jgi:hypothetical protein
MLAGTPRLLDIEAGVGAGVRSGADLLALKLMLTRKLMPSRDLNPKWKK